MYEKLDTYLSNKKSQFVCIHMARENTKQVPVVHVALPPLGNDELIDLESKVGPVEEVLDFYRRFGGLSLFCDADFDPSVSAYRIAPPSEWGELTDCFRDWVDMVDEDERDDIFPSWVSSSITVGEVPQTGNYVLLRLSQKEHGSVYKFEHDGFEFVKLGDSFSDFVDFVLEPDEKQLEDIATHLRFTEPGDNVPGWFITELHNDVIGSVVRTDMWIKRGR